MKADSNINEPEARAGLPGTMRFFAALAVAVIAALGVLIVFDVIPAEALKDWAGKAGISVVIIAAAAVAITVLVRSGDKKS
jgi:hypothetical protein